MTGVSGNDLISVDDIRHAASQGIIGAGDAERLVDWVSRQGALSATRRESRRGLNIVSVAYYFGALLMISACAWFLGDKWKSLGDTGILVTCLVYAAVATGTGLWLRRMDFPIAGGLLVTVAVSLTPLITYTIEDMVGRPLAGRCSWLVQLVLSADSRLVGRYGVRNDWGSGHRAAIGAVRISRGADGFFVLVPVDGRRGSARTRQRTKLEPQELGERSRRPGHNGDRIRA